MPVWRLFTHWIVINHTRMWEWKETGTGDDEFWQLSSVLYVCVIMSLLFKTCKRKVRLCSWDRFLSAAVALKENAMFSGLCTLRQAPPIVQRAEGMWIRSCAAIGQNWWAEEKVLQPQGISFTCAYEHDTHACSSILIKLHDAKARRLEVEYHKDSIIQSVPWPLWPRGPTMPRSHMV